MPATCVKPGGKESLRRRIADPTWHAMWSQPYLETCCRSALHRLSLCGAAGRPPGLKDGPCLERLSAMGFVRARPDGRYEFTPTGIDRHASEILHISVGA
jgi:hypothetical protein